MMKPFEEQDIVEKLRNRAEIRRKIGRTVDGKPDRIADTCEEAATEIMRLRAIEVALRFEVRHLLLKLMINTSVL